METIKPITPGGEKGKRGQRGGWMKRKQMQQMTQYALVGIGIGLTIIAVMLYKDGSGFD